MNIALNNTRVNRPISQFLFSVPAQAASTYTPMRVYTLVGVYTLIGVLSRTAGKRGSLSSDWALKPPVACCPGAQIDGGGAFG